MSLSGPLYAGRIRLLIIDNDEGTQQSLSTYLSSRGGRCQIVAAPNAQAAVALLERAQVDAVVCSVSNPESCGCELHAKLTQRWPELARSWIFIGTPATEADREYIKSVPAPLMSKPLYLPALADAITQAAADRAAALTLRLATG